MTWPLAPELGEVVPAGQEWAATVPLASSWALWWTADRIAAGLTGFWDAPIMAPADGTFAFSEPMPLLGALSAPVQWLGGSLALAHGLVVLLCLVLNGWSIERLLRRLGGGDAGAIAGGAIGVLLPYVQSQLGVLTLVPIFALVWTLHAAVALADDPRWWRGALLGLALAAAYLMCAQHALFLILAAGPAALWLVRRDRLRRTAVATIPAALVAAALVAPPAIAQHRVIGEHDFERSAERIRDGSASLPAWARAPSPALLPLPPVWREERKTSLFPGYWKLLLAIAGGAWAVRRRRESRRAARFILTAAAIAFAFSLLPRVHAGWLDPWSWLRAVVPGLDQLRSVHRFGVIVHLAVAVFAGLGVHWLLASATRRQKIAIAAIAVMAVVEIWPRDHWLAGPPSRRDYAPLLDWIERETGPDDTLLHLPFPRGGDVGELEPSARAMYLATYHRRPIANGYSSYWPQSYRDVRRGFRDVARDRDLTRWQTAGVRYVIVHTRAMSQRARGLPDSLDWPVRFRDEELSIVVYELPRAGE